MHDFWNNLHQLLDPEKLLREGGFYLVVFVIYAETGLFFGFFLPGDYLLFLAGMFVATGKLDVNIAVLLAGLCFAAISGNFTGYWFGRKTGPVLYTRKDSFFFKKRYLKAAEDYYHKQGAFALIMGRFVPIVRTFAPIFAGVVKLEFKKFALYNVVGGVLWICSLTLLGYFLGRRFEKEINDYLLYIIIGFILITTIPLLITFVKSKVVSGPEEDKTDLN
ncbi:MULTISPECIES: DedA family protein [Pedobacter]|jgi:membrane-associated protein|uniref:DedA family protein n=1 Tax=Pedobacter TaxID=84567 RepID=UPI000492EC09|nr:MULTISPECIES: VTT domain-containing protein [Pedobacter]MDQ0968334.1 membrane-associated protein [Flavobacterium sp. W4I14]MBT2559916.1 VTT domain-containing protein [Pedobacter sp. ISL-64]MBT2592221.1 VTT domain-containing protein [Pedobacter sp. ISL-68]CAH0164763.1 putative membrane protein Rv0364 [Pedobacter sp. Bi36]CAH0188875.1 putative membrane protein Rv0364 [Pedobacter sp. Bi27]